MQSGYIDRILSKLYPREMSSTPSASYESASVMNPAPPGRRQHMMPWALGIGLLTAVSMAMAQVGAPLSQEEELAQSYGDTPFVSIATGNRQLLSRAPAVATVITAQDIADMGATDLDQVLDTVPGLHVARETQGFAPVYVIRGINLGFNPQVLVLLNGRPLNTVYTGNRGGAWGGMPLEHVERIEIIRGPGSALYGADAFSGVINVIQKSSTSTPGTQWGGRVGSFNTLDSWVSHVGPWGPADVSAYLRVGQTQGAKRVVEADAQTGYDRLLNTQASLAPGVTSLGRDFMDASLELSQDAWRWSSTYWQRNKLGLGTGVASALDPHGHARGEHFSTELSYDNPHWGEDWSVSAHASFMHYKELSRLTLYPPGAGGGAFVDGMIGNPDKWERHERLSLSSVYTGWRGHRWRMGLGLEHESVYKTRESKNFYFDGNRVLQPIGTGSLADVTDVSDTAPFMVPHGRTNRYFFVQDEWSLLKDWTLTAGWRQDHYSDFGSTSNPRVALVWDAAYSVTAKLLYGRAFRAPSLSELYAINNPVIKGNSALLPERIETFEAALAWQPLPSLRLGVNVFEFHMTDVIELVSNQYQNGGRLNGRGLELETHWDINRTWSLSGHYSYQRGHNDATGSVLANAPNSLLYGRVDWHVAPGWSVHPQVNWVGERPRVQGDPRAPLAGYVTMDLTVRAQPSGSPWQFSLSARNLFDADAREPSPFDVSPGHPFISLPGDFPLPGRALVAQAVYQF
jgi:outer membrane receptor for ferrienterochelin and colicins